jgi:hypothetical protein
MHLTADYTSFVVVRKNTAQQLCAQYNSKTDSRRLYESECPAALFREDSSHSPSWR